MDVLRAGEEAEAAGTGAEATAHRVAARRRSCSEPVRLGARGVLGRRGRQWRSGPAGASSARAFLSPFCTECRDRITELATAKLAPSVKCIAPFLLLSLSSWHLIGHNWSCPKLPPTPDRYSVFRAYCSPATVPQKWATAH